MKLGIGIPTINRYDLLSEALVKYEEIYKGYSFIILDNGHQNIPRTDWYDVIETEWNYGVARSWNVLIEELIKKDCTHFLILNDDVVFDKKIEEITDYIKNNPNGLYHSSFGFCVFLTNTKVLKEVGKFDILFYPMYYEDNDYSFRCLLENSPAIKTEFFDPISFKHSKSTEKSPELNNAFDLNTLNYKLKWGGMPGKETFYDIFGGSHTYGGPFILREYNFVKHKKTNLSEHTETILKYALNSETIIDAKTETGIMFRVLAASGKKITTYDKEFYPLIFNLIETYRSLKVDIVFKNTDILDSEIDSTDLLCINEINTNKELSEILLKFEEKINKYIIITNTEFYGFQGEDGKPGLLNSISQFLIIKPNWKILETKKEGNGLTILQRI